MLLLAPSLLFVVSIGTLVWAYRTYQRIRSVRAWEVVEGVVDRRGVRYSYWRKRYIIDLTYSYTKHGRTYTRQTIYPGGLFGPVPPQFWSRASAQRALLAFGIKADGSMRVYVNPASAGDSAVVRDIATWPVVVWGMVATALAIAVVVGAFTQ